MNRRDFLRNAAIAGSATAVACDSLRWDPKTPPEKVLPYVKQDDDVLPGTAAYYATTCTGCASACGLLARAKDGRVVHVAGNPDHPSGGGLCTRGHMVLLEAYSPDRFESAMDAGQPAAWDATMAKVAAAATAARAAGKAVAWLGTYRTGSAGKLLAALATSAGVQRVHWDPLGVETLLAASRAVFGKETVPTYDLSDARAIVSFGMDFLATSLDTLHLTRGWSDARDPAHGGFVARFVAIEPRIGSTSSKADKFLAPKAGTEALVAMALAKLVRDKAHYAGPAGALVDSVDVAAASSASGISSEKLEQVAGWIAEAPSVVLPGGHANAGADATALAIATLLINEYAGNVGRSVVFGRELQFGQVNSYADVKSLLEDARAGKIGVLFVDGLDPVYNLPVTDKVEEALDAVGTLVHLLPEANDSLRPNSIVLTTGSGLEEWGDASPVSGVNSILQPAMLPLKDTRSVGDVLLALGKALGAPPVEGQPGAFDAADFAAYVKARWQEEIFPLSGAADFEAFWVECLQRGGFFQATPPAGAAVVLGSLPATASFAAGSDPALVLFPHPHLGDGRHANRPWAQELPDPVSTFNWNTWAEISPATAAKLGLGAQDNLKIRTEQGEIEVGYFASPAMPDDVVAVSLGNGRTAGRYARGRGVNPLKLIAAAADPLSGALVYHSARASISRGVGESDVLVMSGNINQDGRPVANTVTVADAVANVDGAPGSIVHLHVIPVDERLTRTGLVDMFPEPQHPTYRFAMAIDTNACTGCAACVVACNLENNIPFVGPDQVKRGRMMSWIRMNRFYEGSGEDPDVRHMPSLCQHCAHAPCEGVCPVLATYHNLDGLNAMIYNRCVGTRYCANNCPYTARRFNFHTFQWPESMHLMLNPDVSTREMGVMEKCTFCVQRLRAAKDTWRDVHEVVPDSALVKLTACAAACPSGAITFGNAKDSEGTLAKKWASPRAYTLLGELNTKPGIRYLARARFSDGAVAHGGGHGAPAGGHGAPAGGGHGAPDHGAPAGHGEEHGGGEAPAHKEG
jgi:molybdopterin-containing oxidoreductase family iron-sulfur binding subunit